MKNRNYTICVLEGGLSNVRVNLLLPPQLWKDLRVVASKEGQSRSNFIRGLLVAAVQGRRRASVTPIYAVTEPEPEPEPAPEPEPEWKPAPYVKPTPKTPRDAEELRLWKIYRARILAKTAPADSAVWKAWLAEQMANWVDPVDAANVNQVKSDDGVSRE